MASTLTHDLVNLLMNGGRLPEALTLADQKQEYTRQAGLGPWTRILDVIQRMQILQKQGHHEKVLTTVRALRDTMTSLPEQHDANERAIPWNARECVLNIGFFAARDLKHWREALVFIAEQLDSMRRRDASRLEQARTRYNAYFPLLRIGHLAEARALLFGCRQVFEDENDLAALGSVLSALADLEDELKHADSATRLEQDGLRLSYAAGDPEHIAASHFNLANDLQRAGQEPMVALAHRLACAVIRFQTGSGRLADALRTLAHDLAGFDGDPPGSFAELCQIVDQTEGVHLAQLVDRLPQPAGDGEAALAEVLRLGREFPTQATQARAGS